MIPIVVAAGLGLLALPALLSKSGRRLQPGPWAVLCSLTLLTGTTLVLGSALVVALPLGCYCLGFAGLARNCQRLVEGLYPGGSFTSVLAVLFLVSVVWISARAIARARRSIGRARRGSTEGMDLGNRGPYEVVVVPDERRYALSVPLPGHRGRMVISQGVVDALDGPELDLVCAHEAAHLRLRHRHFLVFALMVQRIFWFWPPTQISTSTLRLALERWADEVAAGDSQELRKRLQVALLAVAGMANEPAMAAFSAADGLMDRITCLDSVPRRRHPGWWIVALAPALAFGIATVVLGTQIVHEILCLVAI